MEQNLKLIEKEIQEALKKNKAYVQTIMSMPGIGMITSLAIMSYWVIVKDFLQLNKRLTTLVWFRELTFQETRFDTEES
ncbi:hypothetical protein LEP1GSC081_4392 [Leptospira kirschneri str. H1]|uniref:Transposase, IS116/IS110/IS902 domain protein n=1 Tax=Leptospira kirschneri str. H1 TaxID=1049966 RepID=A0A0E2B1L6_9LEPT|nr:hypothetical protein LEP1GSC081_4392 [Leptospira kirschneri str. H1]